MSEHHLQTGEMYEAEEVLDVVFPSGDEAAEVVHPGEEPLDLPSSPVAVQLTPILCLAAVASVGRNHFDVVCFREPLVEFVGVVSFVSDEPRRQLVKEASGKNLLHKLALGWRSAVDSNGERKTVSSGESDDLRALAATRGTDGKAPFFALANVASTKASSRFSSPRSCR
jgi:hypothetical protein